MTKYIFSTFNDISIHNLDQDAIKRNNYNYGILNIADEMLYMFNGGEEPCEQFTFEELTKFPIEGRDEKEVFDIRGIGGSIFIGKCPIMVTGFDSLQASQDKTRQQYYIFNEEVKLETYAHEPNLRECVKTFLRKYSGRLHFVNQFEFIALDYNHQGIVKRGTELEVEIRSDAPNFVYSDAGLVSTNGNKISRDGNTFTILVDRNDVLFLNNKQIAMPEFHMTHMFKLITVH